MLKDKEKGDQNFMGKHNVMWVALNINIAPMVEIEINANEFQNTTIQFFLYAIRRKEEQDSYSGQSPTQMVTPYQQKDPLRLPFQDELCQEEDSQFERKLIGECYVSL